MIRTRDNYPPNAYRSGCAITRVNTLRPDERMVVVLPIGLVAEKRGDGNWIPDREVCLSEAAAREVGATVGMVEASKHAETVAQLNAALDEASQARAQVEELQAELARVRQLPLDDLADVIRAEVTATVAAALAELNPPAKPSPSGTVAKKTPAKRAPTRKATQ